MGAEAASREAGAHNKMKTKGIKWLRFITPPSKALFGKIIKMTRMTGWHTYLDYSLMIDFSSNVKTLKYPHRFYGIQFCYMKAWERMKRCEENTPT
ncbi:MAG: hypothetical protein HQL86_04110 [Magnetococcales bacterium]|nr:hypothetical protein [Magnetococcales bacterium]